MDSRLSFKLGITFILSSPLGTFWRISLLPVRPEHQQYKYWFRPQPLTPYYEEGDTGMSNCAANRLRTYLISLKEPERSLTGLDA
eukprot:6185040-Pleurochrysis_carterae.AAC.1